MHFNFVQVKPESSCESRKKEEKKAQQKQTNKQNKIDSDTHKHSYASNPTGPSLQLQSSS